MMRLVIFLVFWVNLFANADLEDAYKKEYAFLVAQKKALQERVEIVKKEAKEKVSSAEKDIAKLQEKYIANSSDSEKKAQQLLEIEREAQTVQDDSATLEATLLQADLTLKKYGFATQEKEPVKKLQEIFVYSPKLLNELSSIRKTKGSFYIQDGSKIDGEIIQVGNVAAYGIGEKTKGILVPAGEGEYKLFNQNILDFEDKLTNTGKNSIGIFLFESLDKEIEEKKEKTVLGIIESGGSVAWVITWLGLFAAFLVILRVVFLKRASMDTNRVSEDVAGFIEKGQLKEANEKCATYKNATSRVLSATIRNLDRDRDRDHLEDIINESILHENGYLDKFGSTIIIIAAVSPLLGLLGTVTGMISTFDIITEFGTGDPKMLSGGISEALITTELGLVVAIPALIFGNLLSGWAENIKDDMEKAALKVINIHKQNTIKA